MPRTYTFVYSVETPERLAGYCYYKQGEEQINFMMFEYDYIGPNNIKPTFTRLESTAKAMLVEKQAGGAEPTMATVQRLQNATAAVASKHFGLNQIIA